MNQPQYAYALDADSARSHGAGASINETGAYVGKITKAMEVTSSNGNPGIEIDFETEDGRAARYMTIWMNGSDGRPNRRSKALLDAIMAALGIRGCTRQQTQMEVYDKDAGGKTTKTVTVLPELMTNPIGFVLQKELSTYNGKERYKMLMHMPFDANTRQTAKEKLDQTPAQDVENSLKWLTDYDRRDSRPQGATAAAAQAAPAGADFDFDDDIPF